MQRNRRRRRGLWALGIAVSLVAFPPSSHGEDWPGLPPQDGTFSPQWGSAAQGGMSYAKRAKQWMRTPDAMVTFNTRLLPFPREGNSKRFAAEGQAFLVSPTGAPDPYGYMAPITVRSVGFGLMPVEATVQISQRRKDGYPIPFVSQLAGTDIYDPSVQATPVRQVGHPVDVEDAMNVRILKVLVDGVDLGLAGDCRTVTPAPVTMTSPEYVIPFPFETNDTIKEWFRDADPASFFHPLWGGQLSGSITIPPFTGCTTASGDDLSDLMTLSVSGPDNPVSARIGWPCFVAEDGAARPFRAGENTPRLAPEGAFSELAPPEDRCYGTAKFTYPARDQN